MLIKKLLHITTPELCLGVLLIFSSSIGQTFFISLFSGEIRSEFNLSHGILPHTPIVNVQKTIKLIRDFNETR